MIRTYRPCFPLFVKRHDLGHAGLMTTAFEFRLEERLDNLLVDLDIDETARQAHNVAVVVLAEQLGEWNRRDGRGANAGYFIGGKRHAEMPVPRTSTPRSASPAETACATFTA